MQLFSRTKDTTPAPDANELCKQLDWVAMAVEECFMPQKDTASIQRSLRRGLDNLRAARRIARRFQDQQT